MGTDMTTSKEALELKGCPFCGATPHRGFGKTYHDQLHGEPHQDFSIWCPKGHAKVTGVNAALAADEWNTRATASLEGDAVERVARIMVRSDPNYCTYHMPGDTPRDWKATSGYRGKTSELSESAAESVRVRARAILTTGLVPDEAAIRADEREKCAKVCDQIRNNAERRAAQHENGEARNSALDKMEGAIQCAAAIRSGGG